MFYILDSLESVNIFAKSVRRKCVSVVVFFFIVKGLLIFLPPVVQTFDSAFFQTNHYPVDKYSGKKSRCALERSLYNG